jgi:Co/Zn/Cd efflux system component
MNRLSPVQLMFIGLVLLLIGVFLPFVMVLRLIEPTLLLNFLAYFASFFGLIIGLYGVVQFGTARRNDKDMRD